MNDNENLTNAIDAINAVLDGDNRLEAITLTQAEGLAIIEALKTKRDIELSQIVAMATILDNHYKHQQPSYPPGG